jgi:adenylosuccinate lyase
LEADPEISKILNRHALEKLLDPTNYVGNSGAMVDRVLNDRKG